jgi:hypothetical protein
MARKLVNNGDVSVKDENGIFTKVSSAAPKPQEEAARDPSPKDIILDDMMDNHMLLLFRETRALVMESKMEGRLSKESAYAMRENLKLLCVLKKAEKDLLEVLPNKELDKLISEKKK